MIKQPVYKGFYNIVKNESKKEAIIYIYGVIGGFDWEKYTFKNTSDRFVADFNALDADVVHVKINSPGGNVHEGLPIYNALKNSEKTIYTYVDGIAYSMAALIALAGDKVIGYNNSLFMVHNGSTGIWGNAQDLIDGAEVLKKYDESLGSIIEEKLNITDSAVKEKYLNYKDNYFTGKEALSEGFFDELIDTKKASVPDNIAKMDSKALMEHYAKMNIEIDHKPNTNMSTTKNRQHLQTALGYTEPLTANDNGSYLQDVELDAIEAHLGAQEARIATTENERQAAVTNLERETNASNAVNTALGDALQASGIELEANATPEEKITALKNHIASLGTQPGAVHTNVPKGGDEGNEHAYLDFSAPHYQINN